MAKELITVLIANWNSSKFVDLNLEALKRLMYYKYKVIICNNYYSDEEDRKIFDVVNKYNKFKNIELINRVQSEPGSIGHGESLDIMIDKVNTKYFVILDADNVFLYYGWDKKLIDHMKKNDIKICGTQASTHKSNKYKDTDFPFMFGMIVDTNMFKELDINMTPCKKYDTGGMMKEKFLGKNYKYETFIYKSTRDFKTGPFNKVICAEYYSPLFDSIVCSHFGRGSTYGMAKYAKGIWKYIYKIFPFVATWKFNNEIKMWMKICRKIINGE